MVHLRIWAHFWHLEKCTMVHLGICACNSNFATFFRNAPSEGPPDTSQPNQIGYAELYAVFRAVQEAPNGSRLLLKVDNKGVVGGLLKGRFRNEEMNALLGLILDELMKNTKFIQSQWVDTHEMEKLGSDDLSRGRFRPEGYTVAPQMFAKVQRICTETFGVFESKIMKSFKTA